MVVSIISGAALCPRRLPARQIYGNFSIIGTLPIKKLLNHLKKVLCAKVPKAVNDLKDPKDPKDPKDLTPPIYY